MNSVKNKLTIVIVTHMFICLIDRKKKQSKITRRIVQLHTMSLNKIYFKQVELDFRKNFAYLGSQKLGASLQLN